MESGNEDAADQLSAEVIIGELIWFKPSGLSWWPAQIVDENSVTGSAKPCNKSTGHVLVRLYGSYKYMYVNPMKCCSEFEKILEQHEGNHTEILKKALEQELSCCKSGRAKRKGTRTEGSVEAKSRKRKQVEVQKNCLPSRASPRKQLPKNAVGAEGRRKNEEMQTPKKTPSHATTPVKTLQELSARRTKVMQTLGLVAPSGSPFRQNGQVYAKLLPH